MVAASGLNHTIRMFLPIGTRQPDVYEYTDFAVDCLRPDGQEL